MGSLPERRSWRAPQPGTTTSLPGSGTRTRTRLPARLWHTPPPAAVWSGSGSLAASASPCATAVFSGSGSAAAAGSPAPLAQFTGEGALITTNLATAPLSGAGTLAVSAVPVATALFSGSGSLTASAVPHTNAPFSGAGSLTAAAVPRTIAPFTGSGALTVTAATGHPMGMNKNGDQVLSAGTTGLVTGWTARSGYPSTVITSNALVSDGSLNVTIQCKVTLTSNWLVSAQPLILRILKNGSQIATANIPYGSATVTFSPASSTLASGDTISLQYTTHSTGFATAQGGSTSTYLYFDAA